MTWQRSDKSFRYTMSLILVERLENFPAHTYTLLRSTWKVEAAHASRHSLQLYTITARLTAVGCYLWPVPRAVLHDVVLSVSPGCLSLVFPVGKYS